MLAKRIARKLSACHGNFGPGDHNGPMANTLM